MPSTLLSSVLLVSCAFLGGLIGHSLFKTPGSIFLFASGGVLLALLAIVLMRIWLRSDIQRIIGGAVGVFFGALLGLILYSPLSKIIDQPIVAATVNGLIMVVSSLIGLQLGSSKAKEWKKKTEETAKTQRVLGILDTSVIIDGRIADICETGFLGGDLIIPEFVLKELQMIADSAESTKRSRGRRGLDILNKIQKQSYVNIIIDNTDYPSTKEVDQKLINRAKETGYPILTNDFNLNKVAEVHSIQVLNVNQLANALKPIVLPGETMKVLIIKEGKETGQGVAYLDDGTMVVVDHGRKYMGKTIEATVTSVLQTTAGRMIFAVTKS
jgi:uncharacterized protein YacL